MIGMHNRAKRALAIVADRVLSAAAPVLVRGQEHHARLPARPRVLVIRCDHIGDAAMAAAGLGALRERLGAVRLDVLVAPWTVELFERDPAVDEVISYAAPWWAKARGASLDTRLLAWLRLPTTIARLRRGRYDIGIDLRGDLRHILFFLALGACRERMGTDRTGGSALLTRCWPFDDSLHELDKNEAILRHAGADLDWRGSVAPPPLSVRLARLLGPASGERGFIALAVRGNKENRNWSSRLAADFARLVSDRLDLGVVYIGGSRDRAVGDRVCAASSRCVNVAGITSLSDSLAVLGAARALVTVDSGPMHLAGLLAVPTLALFGAGDPRQFGPWAPRHQVLGAPHGCHCPLADTCRLSPDGRGVCMDQLRPEAVYDALIALLDHSGVADSSPSTTHSLLTATRGAAS